jgi:hypothetical protein
MIIYSTTTPPIFDTIAAHLYFFDEQKLNTRWSGRAKLPEGERIKHARTRTHVLQEHAMWRTWSM